MSVSTKKGDKGKTHLFTGESVSKDDPRIEACGATDELSSFLGLAKSKVRSKKNKDIITFIQKDLLLIGTELVTRPSCLKKLKKRVDLKRVFFVESNILKIEKKLKPKTSFSITGSSELSSLLDICRSQARRLERRVVTLKRKKVLQNDNMVVYLNRLSDLLYLLARQH